MRNYKFVENESRVVPSIYYGNSEFINLFEPLG